MALLATLHFAAFVVNGRQLDCCTLPTSFNAGDDLQAYLVFPHKMLQTGSLGRNPFSKPRLAAALGGQVYLDTFIIASLPDEYLHLIDPGLASIAVLGLVYGYARRRGLPPLWVVPVLLLFITTPEPVVNITSLVTGILLFCTSTKPSSGHERTCSRRSRPRQSSD